MSDLYLRADNESAMMAAIADAGLVVDGIVQVVGKADVYVIGLMYTTDGLEIPGFHANVRTDDIDVISALEHLSCPVSSPSFVFA